jgi:hypothetical protein
MNEVKFCRREKTAAGVRYIDLPRLATRMRLRFDFPLLLLSTFIIDLITNE